MSDSNAGRPTVITPEVVSILVAAFHSGLTVREACWQAGISHEAFYSRTREDQQFSDTMSRAQAAVTISAKKLIADSISKGNIASAKWWLERHDKDQPIIEDPQNPIPRKLTEEEQENLRKSLLALAEIERHREKLYGKASVEAN